MVLDGLVAILTLLFALTVGIKLETPVIGKGRGGRGDVGVDEDEVSGQRTL